MLNSYNETSIKDGISEGKNRSWPIVIMDKDLARHLVRSMIKSSSEMTSLIPVLKEFCDEEEYKYYGKVLAKISATVSLEVLNEIFAVYPELQDEIDKQIDKYGRY